MTENGGTERTCSLEQAATYVAVLRRAGFVAYPFVCLVEGEETTAWTAKSSFVPRAYAPEPRSLVDACQRRVEAALRRPATSRVGS